MNKLGFYIQNSTVPWVREALDEVQPPVILIHAWDQGLLEELRRFRSPKSLIIGRMEYIGHPGAQRSIDQNLANAWLDDADPEGRGRDFANHILTDNFGLALKEEGGRRLIDAWMSLNECVPGPGSGAFASDRTTIERRLRAYDRFQVGFRNKLMEKNVEAVAFNFGAGNFGAPEHYLDYFPQTLATYTYLGFHEYGWPALSPTLHPAAQASAGTYRPIVKGIMARTGRRYQVVITEAGLARMYKYANDAAGDVGWLYAGDRVSQEDYWRSLEWYNSFLCEDQDFVAGACLFQVGHGSRWETFRLLGQEDDGKSIQIISRIARLRQQIAPTLGPTSTPTSTPTTGPTLTPTVTPTISPLPVDRAALRQWMETREKELAALLAEMRALGSQSGQLQAALSDLARQAQQAAAIPKTAAGYRKRLTQVQAKIGGGPSAQAVILRQVGDLFKRIEDAETKAASAGALTAALATTQSAFQAWQSGAGKLDAFAQQLEALQKQLSDLKRIAEPAPPLTIVLANPVPGRRITQYFGKRPEVYKQFGLAGHEGIDFGCPVGADVLAAADGRVYGAGDVKNGYGIRVILRHTWGDQTAYTIYAHLSEIDAEVLAKKPIKAGQVVGKSGNTGNSTGPHLHFSLLTAQENAGYRSESLKVWFQDPWPYLQKENIASGPAWPPEEEEEHQCMPFDFNTGEL